MSSTSLYRKYRPQNFAGLVGQKAAVELLSRSIEKGRVGHAYLFSGERGCGKTSAARIFARALNCTERQSCEPCGQCVSCRAISAGESLSVIEMDGASNNSVDDVRELKENVALIPMGSKYKVYIIDEVHMLSQAAFNALLKTLEEPVENVIFIMATTEPHKVPVTIRSRCQHIAFHRIRPEDIYVRLKEVCEQEGLNMDHVEQEALYEIARQADGALRDALSMLEQVIAGGDITLAHVEAILGGGSRPAFERWVKILRHDRGEAYAALRTMFESGGGGGIVGIFEGMFMVVRDLWLYTKWGESIAGSLGLTEGERQYLQAESRSWKGDEVHLLLTSIVNAIAQARQGMRADVVIGMFMLSLEHAPQIKSEPYVPPVTPVPPLTPVVAHSTPVVYDAGFKNELLKIAHTADFVIYCLLFKVKAYKTDVGIVIEAEHPYTWDRLINDTISSKIAAIFESFGTVTLSFHGERKVCKKYVNVLDEAGVDEERLQILEEAAAPEGTANIEHVAPHKSVFDKYKQQFMILGARPEELFIRHMDVAEEDDNAEMQEEEYND